MTFCGAGSVLTIAFDAASVYRCSPIERSFGRKTRASCLACAGTRRYRGCESRQLNRDQRFGLRRAADPVDGHRLDGCCSQKVRMASAIGTRFPSSPARFIHASRFSSRPIVVGCHWRATRVPIPRFVNSAAICRKDAQLAIRSASTGWRFLARSTAAALFAGASRSAPLRPSRTPRALAACVCKCSDVEASEGNTLTLLAPR